MRKLCLLCGLILLAVGLVACSQGGEESSSKGADSSYSFGSGIELPEDEF